MKRWSIQTTGLLTTNNSGRIQSIQHHHCISINSDNSLESLIEEYGYPLEKHRIFALDGFPLCLFRIPFGRRSSNTSIIRPAVFLQHGLLDSCASWTINPPDESLAYILADAGYDVWMGNSRGSTYSLPLPTNTTSTASTDWSWSWDEMAAYDIPACIDAVLAHTGHTKLNYIGHSQGSTIILAHLSSNANMNDKLHLVIALAPAVFATHQTSQVLKLLIELHVSNVLRSLGEQSFGQTHSQFYSAIVRILCDKIAYGNEICDEFLYMLAGSDSTLPSVNLNNTRFPLYAKHYPSCTSLRNMVHWTQSVVVDKFVAFDFGFWENIYYYHRMTPPPYKLSNIDVDIAVFYGQNDALADVTDINQLMNGNFIPKHKIVFHKQIFNFNHIDFTLGIHANHLVYDDVIELLTQYNSVNY